MRIIPIQDFQPVACLNVGVCPSLWVSRVAGSLLPAYSSLLFPRKPNPGASSSDFLEGNIILQTKTDYPEGMAADPWRLVPEELVMRVHGQEEEEHSAEWKEGSVHRAHSILPFLSPDS